MKKNQNCMFVYQILCVDFYFFLFQIFCSLYIYVIIKVSLK